MAEIKKKGKPAKASEPQIEISMDVTGNSTVKNTDTERPVLKQKQNIIPLTYVIPVRSAVEGVLVYVSRKTGYQTEWENYGVLEYLTFDDLVGMRNSAKSFFVNNWIFIEDTEDFTMDEIYKALQVDKYYKDVLEVDDIDEILSLDFDEFEKRIQYLSQGVKEAIVTRAKKAIVENNPIMDSIRKRDLIEQEFDVELIPRDI